MKLSDFIAAMALKFNIDTSNPAFADILSSAVDVPDSVATMFVSNNSLMTAEAAKNNSALKMHFRAAALGPLDRSVEDVMAELELPEEIRAEIKGNNNTYEKIPALMRKIKEYEAQKSTASGKDKTDLTTKINELNQKVAEAVNTSNSALAERDKVHAEEIKDLILNSKIASRKLDTSRFDMDLMLSLARQKVDSELVKKGAKIVNQNRTLVLKQVQDDGLDYYENSQPMDIDTLIDQVLANNKLLAVTGQPPAPGANPLGFPPLPPVPGQPRIVHTGMQSKLDIAMNDYKQGTH